MRSSVTQANSNAVADLGERHAAQDEAADLPQRERCRERARVAFHATSVQREFPWTGAYPRPARR